MRVSEGNEAILPESNTLGLSSFEATGRYLMKVHAIALTIGKKTCLLGMLDKIEIDVDLPVVTSSY